MNKIKIALQKSGRLCEESIKYLKDCGINITFCYKDKLRALAINFPMELFFLRDNDIPKSIQDGIADIGIVGKNVVSEQKRNILIKEKLGFGICRISLAVTKETRYKNLKDISGKCVATSYPNLLKNYFEENNICSDIVNLSGSVEVATAAGISYAICDIISSGETLFKHNLKEIEQVFASEAVLLCLKTKFEQQRLVRLFIFRLQAVKRARNNKYLLFFATYNKLDKIFSFFGKNKAVLTIRDMTQYNYLQIFVDDKIIWNTIYNLKINGAKHAIALTIQKLIYNG